MLIDKRSSANADGKKLCDLLVRLRRSRSGLQREGGSPFRTTSKRPGGFVQRSISFELTAEESAQSEAQARVALQLPWLCVGQRHTAKDPKARSELCRDGLRIADWTLERKCGYIDWAAARIPSAPFAVRSGIDQYDASTTALNVGQCRVL